MGAKQSVSAAPPRPRAFSSSDVGMAAGGQPAVPFHPNGASASSGRSTAAMRLRSLQQIQQTNAGALGAAGGTAEGQERHQEEEEDALEGGFRLVIGSLPSHLSPHLFEGFNCPVCSKVIPPDEVDIHLVVCLTKPKVTYNEDILTKDTGECAICLEELLQGDTIARLPCLCIYHKGCIDEWFEVNRSCPEHPSD